MLSIDRYVTSYTRIETGASVPSIILAVGGGTLNLESYVQVGLRNAGSGVVGGVAFKADWFRRQDAGTVNTFLEDGVRRVASITTATTTPIVSYLTTTGVVYEVIGHIVVTNFTDSESAFFWIYGSFQNLAGVLTQVGSTQPVMPPNVGPNQAGLSAGFSISGTTINLNLTTDSTDVVRAHGNLQLRPCTFAA
jgi:hypothetical protein